MLERPQTNQSARHRQVRYKRIAELAPTNTFLSKPIKSRPKHSASPYHTPIELKPHISNNKGYLLLIIKRTKNETAHLKVCRDQPLV